MKYDNVIQKLDALVGLRTLPEESAALAFADPPAALDGESPVRSGSPQMAEYLDWSKQWLDEIYRTLTPDGTFWLAAGDEMAAELKVLATGGTGFVCRNWVVWYYTYGMPCRRRFTRSHTHLFYFVKDEKRHTFNGDTVRIPSARQQIYGDRRANPKGRLPDDTWIFRPHDAPPIYDAQQDVWAFLRTRGPFDRRAGWRGGSLPEQVLGRIIETTSRPDDLVLDPFLGSGTTAAVAKKLGRRYCGFEISDECFDVCQKRLDSISVGDPLTGRPSMKPEEAQKSVKRRKPQSRLSNDLPLLEEL